MALLAASFAVSWGLLSAWARYRCRRARLQPDAVLRLRSVSGVFRTRLIEERADGLLIGAPLYRDCYVPFQPGERLLVETPCASGVAFFASTVVSRFENPHTFLIERPKQLVRKERRSSPRFVPPDGHNVLVNGTHGVVENLSQDGARLLTCLELEAGESIEIDLGQGAPTRAWVLAIEPASLGSRQGASVRVRFAEPIQLPETIYDLRRK